MKVLLTGSRGLVGSALGDALRRDGVQLVALRRPQAGARRPARDDIASVAYEPTRGFVDEGALAELGPYDALVNLAGAGIGDARWTPARKNVLVESRTTTTRLVLQALRRVHLLPPVVVSASAIGYYGDRGADLVDEESEQGQGFLAELCGAWEAEALAARSTCRVVLVRSGIVLSPSGGALAKQLPLFRLGLGGRLGSGKQYTSWITLRDEVAVVRRALDDPALAGPVNAVAPNPVTNADLSRAIGEALGRPAVLAVPRPALDAVLGRQMTSEMLLASQRVVPRRLLRAGHGFADEDIARALHHLLRPGS